MEQLYLIECIYENDKQRVVSLFSKDPYSNKCDFTFKERFNPYFYIDLPKELLSKLLSDFRKEIKIEKISSEKIKITARDKETLDKVYKVISFSTDKNILLIESERQYLIEKEWSYYDLFLIISQNRIKKIENNNVSSVVRKYISPFLKEEQLRLIEKLTKKLLLSNLLKVNPASVNNQEILNTLFENLFFKNKLVLSNKSKVEYLEKEKNIKEGIKMDFSNIWPYLLTKDFYNLGHDSINCECCIPKNHLEVNVLSNSLVEVVFKKQGYYFISKDREWGYKYNLENEEKENRLKFMKNNYLKEIPVGPFYKDQKAKIPLLDAFNLLLEDDKTLTKDYSYLKWFCLKEESYLSKIIKEYLKKLKNIETFINLSTSITYNSSFKNKNELENNPLFIQYLTEYKLINDLIEEIPRFMEHRNTKFYDPVISQAIKYLKLEMVERIDVDNKRYLIDKEKVIVKEKKFIEKVNNYFPQINLPIPRLILN